MAVRLVLICIFAATALAGCAAPPGEQLPNLPPVASPGAIQQDL
ncbi:MAG TPA: hypothetical protein VHP58_07045 [Alphaproteobacteria bacterium]|nr:hypothetical protein [Alphaproteobacteria bacterium]